MNFLQEYADVLQKAIFHSVADLFNPEVDLLFIDTTTTYFEIKGEDVDFVETNEQGEESTSWLPKTQQAWQGQPS